MEGEDFLGLLNEFESLQTCPIAMGFRLLGKRWTIEVVRQLYLGDSKFNDFIRHAPGISPRILSMRLKELEGYGIVERSVDDESPVSINYSLTACGRETIVVMLEMAFFTMKHFPDEVFSDGVARTPDQVREEALRSRVSSRVHLSVV